MDKETAKKFDQLSEQFFKNMMRPVLNVYIDWECLQDFELGAALGVLGASRTKTEQEASFQYIKSQLPAYEQATDTDFLSHFPDLVMTKQEMESYKSNRFYRDQWGFGSPVTELFQKLPETLALLEYYNRVEAKDEPLMVHCHSQFEQGDRAKTWLTSYLRSTGLNINTNFTYGESCEYGIAFWSQMEMIYLYDLQHFVQHPITSILLISEGTFVECQMFAYFHIDPEQKKLLAAAPKNIIEEATMTEMNKYANFMYIPKRFPTEGK